MGGPFRPPSLLYFNVDHVRQVAWDRLQNTPDLRLVVCDLSASPVLDVAGANMILSLQRDLAKRNIRMRVVEAHAKVRDLLRAVGLEERVGYLGRQISIDRALEEFEQDVATRAP